MSLSELRARDVVNTCDGRRLGKVMDIEFDAVTGCVTAIVVPGETHAFQLLRGERCGLAIPWARVHMIGGDVILVTVDPQELE